MQSKASRGTPNTTKRGAAEFPRITIRQFIRKIRTLPAARPAIDPRRWYLTQKQHWLGWLSEYNSQGYYGRIAGLNRDARYAYNHIVEADMLLWLISAARVPASRVRAARAVAATLPSLQRRSAAIRKIVPWEMVAERLWPSKRARRSRIACTTTWKRLVKHESR